jgi:hypothetical protein
VGYARGLNHPDGFQFNWLWAQIVEQADATTQQDRRYIDMDFVK